MPLADFHKNIPVHGQTPIDDYSDRKVAGFRMHPGWGFRISIWNREGVPALYAATPGKGMAGKGGGI